MTYAWLVVAIALLAAPPAHAEPIVLRVASPAPEGTAWAREGKAWARDLESLTDGALKMKFYLGGITGSELETADRMRRGQIHVIASGGALCMKAAPSMRALRIIGLIQTREESAYVSGRLRQTFDEELRKAGFVNLGEMGIGPDVVFSSKPVRSMADFRGQRIWVWDVDDVAVRGLKALGIHVVPAPLEDAGRAYDHNQLDAFFAVPTAALAFQWSARSRYVTDLRAGFLRGCVLAAAPFFDQLSVEHQQALRTATAKMIARIEDVGRRQDEQLLGGLLDRKGVQRIEASQVFRGEFMTAARAAREQLGESLVPKALLSRVMGMLADFRAEHGEPR